MLAFGVNKKAYVNQMEIPMKLFFSVVLVEHRFLCNTFTRHTFHSVSPVNCNRLTDDKHVNNEIQPSNGAHFAGEQNNNR
jgi:hypothetical protein